MRKMVDGEAYTVPSTIEYFAIIDELLATLKQTGVIA
jgi:hypothetical protein